MTMLRGLTALVFAVAVSGGCAHYVVNAPQTSWSATGGHRFPPYVEARPDPADELFVCLSFSGGGTRAAAFAHGALMYLGTANIGRGRTLLDEVDCIAGISGGAFAAAYYGLFGRAGLETFPKDFLERNIERELALKALNPVNLVRLASPRFSRSDLAAELYDQTVFQRKTFASFPVRPFVILHATSMANSAPFEFTQDEFDLLGSDLSAFPVARAVAASSAFPILLSPISLRSYPARPELDLADIEDGAQSAEDNPGRARWSQQRLQLMAAAPKEDEEPTRKWVHLLDGGLADNIGLRSIIRAYERGFLNDRINATGPGINRLVFIAINARTDPPETLSRQEASPGLWSVFMKTTTVSMETVTVDSLDLAIERQRGRRQAQTDVDVCNSRLAACGGAPLPALARDIRTCFVHITFEDLPPGERDELLSFPTSFALSADQLAKLRKAAATLLERSEPFQQLLRVLREEPSSGAGIPGISGNCS